MDNREQLVNDIITMASDTLNVNENEIDPAVNIQDLGFTSVTLVSFVEKVSDALNEEVHPGVFFEYSSLSGFIDYLLDQKKEAVSSYLTENPTEDGQKINETENAIPRDELPQNVPVIIGGGIAGMMISRQLSKNGIQHIIVGPPHLGDTPKLGESMTEAATIELTRDLKDYSQYFYPKESTPFFMGDIVAGLRFDFFGTFASLFLDNDIPPIFIHVDRIGFDKALHTEVSSYELCHWVNELVDDVEYSEESDKVTTIKLKNGQTITPSYVWDCTNHIRLLGRKLNIPYENFDPERRVVFTHYYQKDGQDMCEHKDIPWMHSTTLLRADEQHDKIKGVSWFIPLGTYVSVGVSMEPNDMGDMDPEEVMAALTRAYKDRGLDYTKYFSRRKEVICVPSQHYMYDRLYGSNWALVGGSSASAWFTSGSNISIVTCMTAMADKIINEPEAYGEHYTRHVKGFIQTQRVYDTFLDSNIGPLDAMKFLASIVEQAKRRISSYYMFRKGTDNSTADVAKDLFDEEVLMDKQYFEFLRQIATHVTPSSRTEQTNEIFEKLSELKDNTGHVKIPYLRDNEYRHKKSELFI